MILFDDVMELGVEKEYEIEVSSLPNLIFKPSNVNGSPKWSENQSLIAEGK